MRKLALAGSTAIGIVIGGIAFNAVPAYAEMPVLDASVMSAVMMVKSVLDGVNSAIKDVKNYLSATGPIAQLLGDGTFGTIQQLLQGGFTQLSNYMKASVGAIEQVADASNTAMAHFQRTVREAEIRDQHTPSPTACLSLDGGTSTQAAAIQAYEVGAITATIHDQRGEADPGMPSYYGRAQGVAANAQQHMGAYRNRDEAAAGLCSLSATPNADQRASTFYQATYTGQAAVTAAKDYVIALTQPVAPAALRGDQLASTSGQEAAMERRTYNARMSLARTMLNLQLGMQAPSVPLTQTQRTYLTNMGLPAQATASWLQVLQIESERRMSDLTWNATLQSMPPASVARETASELALNNYLQFQNYKLNLMRGAIEAARLAQETEHGFMPAARMPTPSVAQN